MLTLIDLATGNKIPDLAEYFKDKAVMTGTSKRFTIGIRNDYLRRVRLLLKPFTHKYGAITDSPYELGVGEVGTIVIEYAPSLDYLDAFEVELQWTVIVGV